MNGLLDRYLFHWSPEKAIWLGGQTLSWDARCAGIYAGFGMALLVHLTLYRHTRTLPSRPLIVAAAALSLPLFVDLLTIHYQLRPAANNIRHLTGVLFGIAFCSLLHPAVALLSDNRPETPAMTLPPLLLLTSGGALLSLLLTGSNQIMSFYLLESLAWIGISGLIWLICRALLRLRS